MRVSERDFAAVRSAREAMGIRRARPPMRSNPCRVAGGVTCLCEEGECLVVMGMLGDARAAHRDSD